MDDASQVNEWVGRMWPIIDHTQNWEACDKALALSIANSLGAQRTLTLLQSCNSMDCVVASYATSDHRRNRIEAWNNYCGENR
jgi:hypothetical protein